MIAALAVVTVQLTLVLGIGAASLTGSRPSPELASSLTKSLPESRFVTGKNSVAGSVAGYDGIGNLTSKAGQAGSYVYDATSKRLTSYAGREYKVDGNGNVINDGLRLIDYTSWNLPWLALYNLNTTVTWDYDHAHSRTAERSSVHGTTFFAPGFELVVPTESTATNPKAIERTYIPTPDGMIGVMTRVTTGSRTAPETFSGKTEYWHKDHLGSLVAITNESGAVTQRFTFDAWGRRSCLAANGTASTCSSNGSTGTEERGFTGHEMLDELGLIHMNGRLYDPELGRFLQADPIIQNPLDGQNYNRYSYVGNNPLSYTDPSGFSRWTKWRRPIIGLVAAFVVPWAVGELFIANVGVGEIGTYAVGSIGSEAAGLTASGQAIANVAGGMAAGGVQGGTVQSALIGAVTAGLQFGVGEVLGHATPSIFGAQAGLALQKMAAHAAIGCASASASGGSCKAGAASAGFSSLAGGSFGANDILSRAAIGAVASKLAGGKAEQGALLAAMEYTYNTCGGNVAACATAAANAARGIGTYVVNRFGPQITQGVQIAGEMAAGVPIGPGSPLALAVRADIELGKYGGHHAFPKYLGGAGEQELLQLPQTLHNAYHAGLDRIWPRGGASGGGARFDALSDAERNIRLDAFERYTNWFDKTFGTSILSRAYQQGFQTRKPDGIPH